MKNIKWDIVGLNEVRKRGKQLVSLKSGHTFYYVGENDKSIEGTGFLIHKWHGSNIISLKKLSNRVIHLVIRLNSRYELKIIHVYAPTTQHSDEKVEMFYDEIDTALRDQFTILCGGFNAKIGIKENDTDTALNSGRKEETTEGRHY